MALTGSTNKVNDYSAAAKKLRIALAFGRGINAVPYSKSAFAEMMPYVSERALKQLKFSDLLPSELAQDTLQRRLEDPEGALGVLGEGIVGVY